MNFTANDNADAPPATEGGVEDAELPPPEGKAEDNAEADDGGGRDESAVTCDPYLDRIKNAQTAEEALAALEKLIEVAFKSRRITVSKADVRDACKITKGRLGEAWKEGGCAAQFLAMVKMFKKGEPGVGRLIGAHVAVAWKVGAGLIPARVTEYAEEGGGDEGKEGNENAGKHKVEFASGKVEWCMMDLREHVAFVGEVGRPFGEAMAATDVGGIVALMGEVRDDADARKAAMLGCVALGSLDNVT